VASNYPFGASLALNTYWIDTIAVVQQLPVQTRAPIATGLFETRLAHVEVTELALALQERRMTNSTTVLPWCALSITNGSHLQKPMPARLLIIILTMPLLPKNLKQRGQITLKMGVI
jgi:hypothetical protein